MKSGPIEVDWRLRERRSEPRRKGGWQTSGGVVLDVETGCVLLVKNRRECREGRSGWTWPKGRVDVGEGPVFTALREIAEEGGVAAEPLARLATIKTRRAIRHYFLLCKIAEGPALPGETVEVRWVSPAKAKRMLERKRDRRILRAAKRVISALKKGKVAAPCDLTLSDVSVAS